MKFRGFVNPKRVLKAVLSIFIVYHLLAIFILPMGQGLVIRELGRYFITYANLFNLNTSWQFFSPGPSPIFYLEYSYNYPADDPADEGLLESESMLLPEKRVGFGLSDHYNRRLYSMRFFSVDPEKIERYLAPWLCRKDERAESISLRQLVGEVESVEKHRGRFGADSFADMNEPKQYARMTFSCGRFQ